MSSHCRLTAAGLVEYLYAEVDTWHTTCSDGTQVFHFASGQAEAHRPDGSKEVRFPLRDSLYPDISPADWNTLGETAPG